jgi:hypothetical protein
MYKKTKTGGIKESLKVYLRRSSYRQGKYPNWDTRILCRPRRLRPQSQRLQLCEMVVNSISLHPIQDAACRTKLGFLIRHSPSTTDF